MIGKTALIVTALALVASPLVVAQTQEPPAAPPAEPQPPPATRLAIQLLPPPPGATARLITVRPNASAVCRKTMWERLECPLELSFRWVGPPGNTGEKIEVFYQDGLYWDKDGKPKGVAAEECFAFPGDQNPFQLDYGANNARTLLFRQDNENCPHKVAFFYDISCVGGAGDNCGGVETLDPATIGDNGRRQP